MVPGYVVGIAIVCQFPVPEPVPIHSSIEAPSLRFPSIFALLDEQLTKVIGFVTL